ncbi:hypothetical protein OG21DRAFT_1523473 [Imleria badia]|nr:hypothetical protein OG21DRAFT_1523473 [Imleria badia]
MKSTAIRDNAFIIIILTISFFVWWYSTISCDSSSAPIQILYYRADVFPPPSGILACQWGAFEAMRKQARSNTQTRNTDKTGDPDAKMIVMDDAYTYQKGPRGHMNNDGGDRNTLSPERRPGGQMGSERRWDALRAIWTAKVMPTTLYMMEYEV